MVKPTSPIFMPYTTRLGAGLPKQRFTMSLRRSAAICHFGGHLSRQNESLSCHCQFTLVWCWCQLKTTSSCNYRQWCSGKFGAGGTPDDGGPGPERGVKRRSAEGVGSGEGRHSPSPVWASGGYAPRKFKKNQPWNRLFFFIFASWNGVICTFFSCSFGEAD